MCPSLTMENWSKSFQTNKTVLLSLVLSTIVLIITFSLRWKNRKVNAFMALFPGPPALPLIGCGYYALMSKSENLAEFLRSESAKYSYIGRFWVGCEPYIFTGDRKIINAVFNSTTNVQHTKDYDFFKILSGGLLCTNGPHWRRVRKSINPCFRSDVLASFGDGFSYHTNVYLRTLQRHADDGKYFDFFAPTHLCFLDYVCDNIMGCRMDLQKRNLSNIPVNTVNAAEMVYQRMFSFLIRSDLMYSLVGKRKELMALTSPLWALATEMVEQISNQRNAIKGTTDKPGNNHQTFMEALLDNVEKGYMTKHQATQEVLEIIIAATPSNSITSAWVLKMLSMRPDMQNKVYREIVETVGLKEITLGDISKLTYLEMLVKEALRHFSIPFVGRHLTEDIQVDENTVIPAGIRILMALFTLHHDPEYWERPNEFYPEHFSPANETKRPKGCFLPFLNGPRSCPGNKYAMQAMKLLLANAIVNFEFSTEESVLVDLTEDSYRVAFLLLPKSGFRFKVKRRPRVELIPPVEC